jgi:hypothetical protein
MGADIYLNSRFEPNKAAAQADFEAAVALRDAKYPRGSTLPQDCAEQKAVDEAYERMYSVGYFRDSYNSTSLFWLLGLSWWQNDFIGARGKMGVRGMRKLRSLLLSPEGQITDERMARFCRKSSATIDDADNSPAAWRAMFERKRERLIALLSEAIELREPLECSV